VASCNKPAVARRPGKVGCRTGDHHRRPLGSIPRTYISCTADCTIPAAAHRLFIDEADKLTPDNPTDVREMTTSHCPFLSEPEQLACILLQL
jgi:hypothetical protein